MNIVSAYWEKENLDLNVAEVHFENGELIHRDSLCVLDEYDYIVANVPVMNNKLIHQLENDGYRFLESILSLELFGLSTYKVPSIFDIYTSSIESIRVTDEETINNIYNEIDNNIFTTDRVSIDPMLGVEYAAKRFKNWIRNSLLESDKSYLYVVRFDAKLIGFFLLQEHDKNLFTSVVAGLFNNYINSGLGGAVLVAPVLEAKKLGGKKIVTRNSLNNTESLKFHLELGYKLNKGNYVFRKFKSK